ncbi:hypothetical protein KEU06_03955 [Pseudaminobacter sp. 19-2017]|uniref:Cell envelope integrity protein TolA n=1 Tax=Pseudaminobacter soli (ex Zhang et al. 2022) TaxID=2831468 RepID=A0A942DWC3_9HYPH|nr:hypothetical protein [Pseudaminobacter soli]MBS3647782.1 hypothetical protein [Pseudaminobacter soli]
MKAGLTTSVIAHVALLGFGLLSLSAPKPLEVMDVESLPVDIVPIEELTQIQQGDKKAPLAEKAAPTPTKRPDVVADAQNAGDNDIDTDNPPTPDGKPKPVKTAEAQAPAPTPVEKPKVEDSPKVEEPKPVPATELAPVPTPKEEVKPEPVKEAEPKPEPVKQPEPKPAEPEQEVAAAEPIKPDAIAEAIAEEQPKPAEESVSLPNAAPAPEARPKPAQAQTAKAPERKASEKPVKEASSRPQSEETGSIEDQVAALLNKEKAKGGGAKRSTQQASLGGEKTTGGSKLSQSEMDALRGQVQRCWNIPAGAMDGANLRVSVKFKLDPSGALDGSPEIISGGGSSGVERAAAEAARRAVARCSPYTLPAEKYDAWADVIVNFDPSEMF